MITLSINNTSVDLNTYKASEDLELYKAQDLLRQFYSALKTKRYLSNWKKSHKTKGVKFTPFNSDEYIVKKGRNGGTYLSKKLLLSLAAYIDKSFCESVLEAFVAMTDNNVEHAQQAVGAVYFDYEKALEVQERWKKFVKWSYKTFGEINPAYGGNVTRLVMRTCLGVCATKNVKGKTDHLLVERLIEQRNYSAVLALDSALTLIKNLLSIPLMKTLLKNSDKKKELYTNLKTMLAV